MDKRKTPRYKRRIQLRFWSADDRNPRKGFTHNVSVAGMFIASTSPFKPGTRVFVEIPTTAERLVLQAEVRNAARVDPMLQKVKPSGMGIRFLAVEELMAELLKLKKSSTDKEIEPEEVAAEAEESQELQGPVIPVKFATPHDLANSYERDIKYGGLFIPTAEPVEEDDKVTVEFRFEWDASTAVRVQASVIKKFAAAEGSATGETVSGVGVAFSDPTSVTTQFTKVMSGLDQIGSTD